MRCLIRAWDDSMKNMPVRLRLVVLRSSGMIEVIRRVLVRIRPTVSRNADVASGR